MTTIKMAKFTLLMATLFVLAFVSSCNQSKISIDGIKPKVESSGGSSSKTITVTSVDVVNNQLVVNGTNLDSATSIKVTGPSGFDDSFAIETKNSSQLIANSLSNITMAVNGLFSLVVSNAQGAATYTINFELQDGQVTAAKLNDMGAVAGEVLLGDGSCSTFGGADTSAAAQCAAGESLDGDGNCYAIPVNTDAGSRCAAGEYLDGDDTCKSMPSLTDTNAGTRCAAGEYLDGDDTCKAIPVDTDTNAGTRCAAGEYLDGDDTCKTAATDVGHIVDGGNATGATLTIGTNDGQAIAIETNNTTRFSIDNVKLESTTTGAYRLTHAGTASASPTYSFTSDLDTGLFRPFADTMAFATGANERLRITSTGNVGVGTIAPGAGLEVSRGSAVAPATSGTTSTAAMRVRQGGSDIVLDTGVISGVGPYLQSVVSSNLANNQRLILNPNGGQVGIGTTTPNELLTIEGNASLKEGAAPTATAGYGKVYVNSGDSKLYFLDSAGTSYDLTATGSGADDLGSHTATQNLVLDSFYLSGDGGDEGLAIDASGNITTTATLNMTNEQPIRWGASYVVGHGGDNNLRFHTNGTERMRINGSNVGIGTSTPSERLTVDGNINVEFPKKLDTFS